MCEVAYGMLELIADVCTSIDSYRLCKKKDVVKA